MEERFGRKEPPHIVRRLLQDLKQDQEESLEEFAERAQELATDGYPDTPDNFVQTLATDAFLKDDTGQPPTEMSGQEQKFSIQEIFSFDKNKKSKTLFIEMKVLGKTFKAVIDSAAQISVLSTSILPLLQSTIKLKEHLVLRGAGKNSKIDARYTEEIPIEIGKLKSKWRFVTANINDNIILGIDFLEKFGAVIDMANYTVHINNEAIPAVCLVGNEGEEINLYRISIKKKTVVPPHSFKIVDMEIDHTQTDDIIIQPKSNLKGLLSRNALIAKDETVKAVFRNDTDTFITLKGGHKFGIGMEIYNVVTDQDDLAEDPEVHSDRVSVNVDNPYSCKTSENRSDRFSVSSPTGNLETLEKVRVGDRVSAGPPQGEEFLSVRLKVTDFLSNHPNVTDSLSTRLQKFVLYKKMEIL
ncbi:Hypothetical predicted protein [Mytilus galloprovincialis]|uniref:Retropepsins domain-containing protein n=1 Tax=Mytilus galloprovincialis TaxID=29158 RepID=A0A8B6CZ23_MYTGA|nr:Hypothetical predicted protein [Mytilus galloprovincialis]